ncbi:MAG: SUMF1/EgtB/PvdO family nonheme iron enzyme [Lentisphaeria bacterium]|nr:SUMF1/EgtB/PvdO family nonheme iron enzyme [Lentisphaeria bacterium]
MKWIVTVAMVAGMMWASGARAGDLDPPGAPAPTMHTLEEIYQQLLTTQQQVVNLQARMIASGMQATSGSMVLIPAGDFVMGDTFGEGYSDELPLHTNSISAFWMDQTETTKEKWDEVYTWAAANGYTFDNAGSGKEIDHPVHTVNWYDCVKWANARSEMDGFTPCYTTNGATYKTGTTADVACNWAASGYRLPTEAEWEKAARGGTDGMRFPWGDVNSIQHTRANYYASPSSFTYDTSATSDYHPDYQSGGIPYTSPVWSFAPNGYGLHDMAGNLYEWCWDWYGDTYYASSPGTDPHGPGAGSDRVSRGGSWVRNASFCRVAGRSNDSPGSENVNLGFRLVRAAQ